MEAAPRSSFVDAKRQQSLRELVKQHILQIGFNKWIEGKKTFIQIRLKSKKGEDRQIDIIKHSDLIDLIRHLIANQNGAETTSENKLTNNHHLAREINDLMFKTQMNALKPDILLTAKLFDYIRS